jgi:putative ABC transport system permease protein
MGWRRFLRRGWWDDERARELETHLAIETDENIARGMSPDAARDAARRKLGNALQIREEIYTMNTIGILDRLWQDLRQAARIFGRTPGFTAVAVLTLALGIGGVTVIYSVIRNILLDPFPYADSRRMVDLLIEDTASGSGVIASGGRAIARGALPVPEFLDYQEQSDVFEEVIGTVSTRPMAMATREGTELLNVSLVTPNTFRFLGVPPLLGRGILDSDGAPGVPPIVVLSHEAWVAQFGAAPDVVGRTITLDGDARTVVGVMPPRFTWHVADAWVPSPVRPAAADPDPRRFWLQARLKPGVTLGQAEAQMNVIAARRAKAHPDEYPKQFRVAVITVIDFVVGRFRGVLYTLFGAVALLLLIACCNVANMLLARATARERELTVRAALGASRWRLMRQLFIESLLLAFVAAAAGCLVAYGGIRAVAYFLPQQNVPYEVELRLDQSALLVSLVTAVATALLFGLLPAWYGARRDLVGGLKEPGKGTGTSFRHGWVRDGIVVGEVALSVVLLLGAGLLMRSFMEILRSDLGFNPSNLVLAVVRFPVGAYTSASERQQFYEAAADRIGAVPGVSNVGLGSGWPGWRTEIERPGMPRLEGVTARFTLCDERYLTVLGLGAIRGRLLTADDVSGARKVAVVNQTLVARYFGRQDPIGQQIRLTELAKVPEPATPLARSGGGWPPVSDPTFEIVGVVRDIRNEGLREAPSSTAYVPTTITAAGGRLLTIRTSMDPELVLESVRRELRAVDRTIAVMYIGSVEAELSRAYAQPRFSMLILIAFAGTGLVLVAVGIYGIMTYVVSRRTQEIAIRMALGADRPRVLRSILRTGAQLLVAGAALGLLASRGTNRLLAEQTSNPPTSDPLMMTMAVVVILTVGLAASLLPALRAARVDPMTALRHE